MKLKLLNLYIALTNNDIIKTFGNDVLHSDEHGLGACVVPPR